MAAAASASAVADGLEHEKSAALKRKRIDLVEAVEHEKSTAMEVVEHEKLASAAVEEEQGGVSVDEDEDWSRGACQSMSMKNGRGLSSPQWYIIETTRNWLGLKKSLRSSAEKNMETTTMTTKKTTTTATPRTLMMGMMNSAVTKSRLTSPIQRFWEAIYPIDKLDDGHEEYDGMVDTSVKFAIKNYNEQHQDHEKLELSKVVRANVKICGGYYFYITLEAKNIATSEEKTYQAQVDYKLGHEEHFTVPIFREKPDNVQGAI